MQKNFHIGKFFERARRRSLRLDITRRAIGVERSFLLWAPGSTHPVKMPKPITSHPSSSSACYHHNVVSSHESSTKHTYPIVKSPEVPTVPASESSRAIDVFKTGSIFCNDDSLLVAGTLDNIPVDMTVDTGSNISIVRPDVLSRSSSRCVQSIPGSSIRTVTGEQAPIVGKVLLQIRIGSCSLAHEFWVADIQDRCILGLDYLRTNDCQVNLREQVLIIGEEEVPLVKHHSKIQGSLKTYRAVLEGGVTLPPHSENVVPAKVEGLEQGEVKWAVVGPSTSNVASAIQDLLVGRTLVTLDQPIATVRLMNLSDQTRHLRKGTVVATCEPVESVFKPTIGEVSGKQLPEYLKTLFEESSAGLTSQQTNQLHDLLCRYANVFSLGPMQ